MPEASVSLSLAGIGPSGRHTENKPWNTESQRPIDFLRSRKVDVGICYRYVLISLFVRLTVKNPLSAQPARSGLSIKIDIITRQ